MEGRLEVPLTRTGFKALPVLSRSRLPHLLVRELDNVAYQL